VPQLISKADLDEVQRWLIQKRFSRFRWGKLIFAPLVLTGILVLALRGPGEWRLCVIGGLVALLAWRIVVTVRSCDAHDVSKRMQEEKSWAPLILAALLLVTGAFDSPLMPMIALIVFFFGTLSPGRALVHFAIAAAAVVGFMLAVSTLGFVPDVVPSSLGGGARSPQPAAMLYWKAAGLLFAIYWAAFVSHNVRQVFRQIAVDAIDARDEVLRNHDAHTRELTALTGELAHELKNPLANMKGLAVLIGRDLHGKPAERLAVLQGEIDRLAGILQSFLTFSRPLVPLSQEEVELGQLCESVIALHEGVAHAGSVALSTLKGEPVHASCDERKVKQVLINLVQNAIDASPPGSTVELVPLALSTGGVRIEVRDRGRGLAQVVREHLFEPGMTTKEHGSGLGLPLARALARQHGGDVALEDREGGGSIAVLTLPRAPALCAPVEAA
jgi:two-component system, NtrC family, sensor histidine kinase HydH